MGLKFNCSNATCRARMEVDDALAGTAMPCPQCGTALHVPQSHDLKFTCLTPECGQHLVVDVSEAGRFLKCPACGKPQRIPGDPPKPIGGEPPTRKAASKPTLAPTDPARFVRRFKHEDQLVTWFFVVTLGILLVIGMAKLATPFLKPGYPGGWDMVLGMKMNVLMVILGLLECGLALWCAWVSSLRLAAIGLLWFAGNWWVYRIGQLAMGQRQSVPAAGAVGERLGIYALTSDRMARPIHAPTTSLCRCSKLVSLW
jgi:hypothetical protein